MISLKTIRKRFVDVTWKDFLHIFLFIFAIPCAFFFKRKHPDLWLICEDKMEARDNGFALFNYIRKYHPNQEIYYAIDKKSPDYKKVATLGKTVPFGTFKHWIYYLSATQNISSQKNGNPNAALCYFLEVGGILHSKRVFIQHGLIVNDLPFLYYENTKFTLFTAGSKPEYDFIVGKFGYPSGAVKLTGLARFDALHENITDPHLILVMPTWRNWFHLKSNNIDGKLPEVENSKYLKAWQEFLSSETLHQILDKYDLKLLFYPHRNMQKFIDLFHTKSDRITICHRDKYDVQNLLRKAQLLITDYSSVFFDMIYMKKPVLFYQFDEEEFRVRQYAQGYFNYVNNNFSCRYVKPEEVLSALECYAKNNFQISDDFLNAHAHYFPLYDAKNSERIYKIIKQKDK